MNGDQDAWTQPAQELGQANAEAVRVSQRGGAAAGVSRAVCAIFRCVTPEPSRAMRVGAPQTRDTRFERTKDIDMFRMILAGMAGWMLATRPELRERVFGVTRDVLSKLTSR